MENGFLNLTWNNHGATYQQMLNNLRIENKLTDCTLACDGQKFFVHRLVLVTCSDFFKSLLEDVPCQHPVIYLRGVNGEEMETLIEFMYLGKVDVPHKEVSTLLSTAETLKIKGLGVVHPEVKSYTNSNFPVKRKRSPLRKEVPYQTTNKLSSSPSYNDSSTMNESMDKGNLPKAIKRDCSSNDSADKNVRQNCTNGAYQSSNKYQNESSCKLVGSDNILSSIFKSNSVDSSSTSASKASEVVLSNVNENSANCRDTVVDSCGKNYSAEETITLTQLLPLNAVSKEHSNAVNFNETTDGHAIDVKFNRNNYQCDNRMDPPEDYTNGDPKSVTVKEEAIDYTRNPQLEIIDTHQSPSSSCRNDSIANTHVSAEDPSQFFDHLSRNVCPQFSYSQDENVENSSESGRPYLCPICRKSFAKVAILKRHHLAHFRPYNCHLCSRSFTRREVLAEHVLEHNGADLRLPCPVCNMTIKRKRNLQAHIKVKHPEYHKLKSANNEALC